MTTRFSIYHSLCNMKKAFRQSWRFYFMEALGLGLFMISACFFGGILEARDSFIHQFIPNGIFRNIIMGIMMGLTALFIFYSRWTAPSGSHINPAVTISFLRSGKINKYDAFFYITFQFIGGTITVYIMQMLMGSTLTAAPVNSVVTVPGKEGIMAAFTMELLIAFMMMTMVMFTSSHDRLKKYTRIITGFMVCLYVIIAGPVSGFGMNPARTFASALPADTWTASWIYFIAPVAGMLTATEFFLLIEKKSSKNNLKELASIQKKIN
jgi:aquaporin Z